MVGNVVVFVCVNVVGALMHSLMETTQRRAFLDTRNCIAARLDMEDENEKLVNIFQKKLSLGVAEDVFSRDEK